MARPATLLRHETMVDILRRHAGLRPERMAYAFLPEQESVPAEQLDYQELVRRSDAAAVGLDRWFATRRELPRMALLLFPAGLGFITAFWGCMSGRVIAIPAAMPRPGRPAHMLEALVVNAGVRLVLTEAAQMAAVQRILADSPALSGLEPMTIDHFVADGAGCPVPEPPRGDDVAFLQYTSGSTSSPKGVVVRHRNLLANQGMIAEIMALDSDSTTVTWLPHYHDMGLIGGLLQPIYNGTGCYPMAPTTFLKCPVRWLKAISSVRGVFSGGPDFGYRLCVERIGPEQAAELDLSSWRVAFNGAEPVRASTMTAFVDRFAVAGFRRDAIHPCYGMAEATLLASCSTPGAKVHAISPAGLAAGRADPPRPGESPTLITCNGAAPSGVRIAIVDPMIHDRCPDGKVGEIWLAGPNVADGYYNDAERTGSAFGAAIEGAVPDPGPWLRTGDLGYLVEGQLYITGRLKEIMIVNGRNLYPHDVEDALRLQLPEIRDAAVFSVPELGDAECIVAVLELAASHRWLILKPGAEAGQALDEIARVARMACLQECELGIDHIHLALPGAVAKTTSGKKRYGEMRSRFQAQPAEVRAQSLSVEADRSMRGRS